MININFFIVGRSKTRSMATDPAKTLNFQPKDKRMLQAGFWLGILGIFGIGCGIAFLTKINKINEKCEYKIVADVNLPVAPRFSTSSTAAVRKQSPDTAKKNNLEFPIHQRLHHEDKNQFPRYLRKPEEISTRQPQHQQRLQHNPELQYPENHHNHQPPQHMQHMQHAQQNHPPQHMHQNPQHIQNQQHMHQNPQHVQNQQHMHQNLQHMHQNLQHMEQNHPLQQQHMQQQHMEQNHTAQQHVEPSHQFLPLPKPVDDGPSFNEFDKDFTKLL
jgi:hypothetical protein